MSEPGYAIPAEKFSIQIDGEAPCEIVSISGLTVSVEQISHESISAQGQHIPTSFPGTTKIGNFTITRGVDNNQQFNTWVQQGVDRLYKVNKRNVTVSYMDYYGTTVLAFYLTNAWCLSRAIADVQAGASNVLIETVGITYDKIKQVS